MLIYSFEKEFIGIDEDYLKIFGFSDLAALQAENKDFADFFVKQPGHIHNFQHVHWIDFIDCAESVEESKVMINVHSKSFTANIAITTIYLTQSPSSKSYVIKLNNLRQLSGDTGNKVLLDIVQEEPLVRVEKPVYAQPKAKAIIREEVVAPKEVASPKVEEKEEIYEEIAFVEIAKPNYDIPLEIDLGIEEETKEAAEEVFIPQDDYVFDPKVASNELGLPVDLIEEFIEDFIAQAREFKSELHSALEEGDIETVAMLSHKLKGVAGNLRIENAYDTLCVINDSKEIPVLKNNIELFYRIVAQLAGEEVKIASPVSKEIPEPVIEVHAQEEPKDDDFILEFKDEEEPERDVVVEYSKTVAASEIGLDIDTFNELLEDYTEAAFALLKDMEEALDVNDIEKCRKKALLLKNMSDSMYIKDLTSDLLSIANISDKNSITVTIDNMNAVVKQISK